MELVPDRLASMMAHVGREQFGRALLDLFDPDLEIIHCAAFNRVGEFAAPHVVVASSVSQEGEAVSRGLAREWMAADYRSDPILDDIERWASDVPQVHYADVRASRGCVGIRARMVEKYYDRLDLGEEATYTLRQGGRTISLSLYKRRGSARFTETQRASLERLSALMLRSTERHSDLIGEASPDMGPAPAAAEGGRDQPDWTQTRGEKFAHLRTALLKDEGHLTLREAEICAYIVMGYTVFAISLLLGISPNTVATHRKRAYSKLGLSSQTELFNVCLKYCA